MNWYYLFFLWPISGIVIVLWQMVRLFDVIDLSDIVIGILLGAIVGPTALFEVYV